MTTYRIVEHCDRFTVEIFRTIKLYPSKLFFGLININRVEQKWVRADTAGSWYSSHSFGDYPAVYDSLADAKKEIARWHERQELEAQPKIIHEV